MSGDSIFYHGKSVSSTSKDQMINVYIWDMDETLILLKSLLNGTYADWFKGLKDVKKGSEIGKMWENHILKICDDLFFYEQIENFNKPFLDALSQYDDGRDLSDYNFSQDDINSPSDDLNKRKLAYRHRIIAHKYKQGLRNIINQEMMDHCDELYNMTDEYTDRWLSSARALLGECLGQKEDSVDGDISSSSRKVWHVNVLVTSGALIPSLVKCLLFRLDDFIAHNNVYSSWEVGKSQCFKWIKERFDNPNTRFCAIGDGWEECVAAQAMRWPFIKIDMHPGISHRFPGLTLQTMGHYFAVVYGSPDAEDDKQQS